MPKYNPEHLHQCVRNLFYQSKVEFHTVYKVQQTLTEAILKDQDYSARVGAYWNNPDDCFMGTLFRVFRLAGKDRCLIELIVWVKDTSYECSRVVGSFNSADELDVWLMSEKNEEKCVGIVDHLLKEIYIDLR